MTDYLSDGASGIGGVPLKSVDTLATGTQTGVNASTLTTIVTLTPTSDKKISRISVSGTDYAKFTVVKNSSIIETKRGGPDRSLDFIFDPPLELNASVPLDVKVEHFVTGETANFEATIYGG